MELENVIGHAHASESLLYSTDLLKHHGRDVWEADTAVLEYQEPVSPGGWASLGICAGEGTVLTEDGVVVFVIIILELPEFLSILAGILVQEGVYRKLPSSFICLKPLEVKVYSLNKSF